MNGVKKSCLKIMTLPLIPKRRRFDDYIEHSIRGYTNLLDDIVSLSRNFVEDETNVIDIGCSTGKLTEELL